MSVSEKEMVGEDRQNGTYYSKRRSLCHIHYTRLEYGNGLLKWNKTLK